MGCHGKLCKPIGFGGAVITLFFEAWIYYTVKADLELATTVAVSQVLGLQATLFCHCCYFWLFGTRSHYGFQLALYLLWSPSWPQTKAIPPTSNKITISEGEVSFSASEFGLILFPLFWVLIL